MKIIAQELRIHELFANRCSHAPSPGPNSVFGAIVDFSGRHSFWMAHDEPLLSATIILGDCQP